ncbi:hypothetical protein CPB85DRAFT_1169581, partial [Mucidula mucida]
QLENHSKDSKEAQCQIMFTFKCPHFSQEDWRLLLIGDYFDFDNVLKHLQSSKASGVSNRTAWHKAWLAFKQAVCFAFTNRAAELQKYKNYIM